MCVWHVHTWVSVNTCKSENNFRYRCLPSILLDTGSLLDGPWVAGDSPVPAFHLTIGSLELQTYTTKFSFMWVLEIWFSPHEYMANTLPTEPSPQSMCFILWYFQTYIEWIIFMLRLPSLIFLSPQLKAFLFPTSPPLTFMSLFCNSPLSLIKVGYMRTYLPILLGDLIQFYSSRLLNQK